MIKSKYWGLIGDAGVVIGKFGNDAKPFGDRIIEIANIVWRTLSRSEELPSGISSPFLSQKNDAQTTEITMHIHAYVHWLTDFHLASLAPTFTLSVS